MTSSGSPSRTLSGHGQSSEASDVLQYRQSHGSTQRQQSGSSAASSEAVRGKRRSDALSPSRLETRSSQTSRSTRAENRFSQREVRTLPPWIDSLEDRTEDLVDEKPSDRLLPSPSRAHPAQHPYTPTQPTRRVSEDGFVDTYDDALHGVSEKRPDTGLFGVHREPVRGRKWDHARERDPVIMRPDVPPNSSPWRSYLKSSMYGGLDEPGMRVDEEFLQQQTPGYQKPWRGDLEDHADPESLAGLLQSKRQRKSFLKRLQHNLLMHPLVPLVFRIIVLTTSCVALGLSGSVHHLSHEYSYTQNSSTIMAIVVDTIAIPYILYITWDEYTGKPLGLRSPKAKIRLTLFDLLFIIFESANIALAFVALADDNGSCKDGDTTGYNNIICNRVKALCGILMVALIAWGMTFAVSIFRLVERVGGREEGD